MLLLLPRRLVIKIFQSSSDGEKISWRRTGLIHKQPWNSVLVAGG